METPAVTAPLVVRDARTQNPMAQQFVRFVFFKMSPKWRQLEPSLRRSHKDEVRSAIEDVAKMQGCIVRTFDLTGTRGDADAMIWFVTNDLDHSYDLSRQLNACAISGYWTQPYHYFSMTKRSTYVENHTHEGQEGTSNRLVISPMSRKYLFVYPFVKTRAWYRLSLEERQLQMDEHIAMGHKYPEVKINTTYSFGLDDQEFVVAFESDTVAPFLDLVQEMRASEASAHTVRDTPSFTCRLTAISEFLETAG